ncbi:hypothetical protein L7F22_009072 [Adiantum nelumboides]|nr:hypothetical protein [Adiantum nelumboides]
MYAWFCPVRGDFCGGGCAILDAVVAAVRYSVCIDDLSVGDIRICRNVSDKLHLSRTLFRRSAMALAKAKDVVTNNPVVVFSKSYCPYCKQVKQLLQSLGVNFKAVELDQESDGGELQAALTEWTSQRTVPNVFIGGQHIGGCDSTVAKHKEGQLVPLLQQAKAV